MSRFILVLFLIIGCVSKHKKDSIEIVTPSENRPQQYVDTFHHVEMSREDMRRIIDSTYSADSIKEVNFLRKNPPSEYEAIMYEKMRTIKSYAQFARRYFTSGSTKDQVRKVQGYPEDVVDVGNLTEVWFYGNCEVTIYNGLVQKVENQTNCINYIDLKVCLISPERRVSSNMQTVIEERTNAYNSTH